MKINSIKFKNICSYGDKTQEIDFSKSDYGLNLITGSNGSGKCVDPDTKIIIKFNDKEIEKNFLNYLNIKHYGSI